MAVTPRKILVQTCCASCASFVLPELAKAGFEVSAFFYNPELEESEEYEKRLSNIKKYCEENETDLIVPKYDPEDLLEITAPYKDKDSIKFITEVDRYRRRRCRFCNSLLIQKTVEQAKQLKIKYFTTTLLCSPYKNHDEIVEISNERALDYGLTFYYQDFRKGYWKGRNFAKNHGLESPANCGCRDSKSEGRLE